MAIRHYLMQVFEPTLLYDLLPSLLGMVAALRYSTINAATALLVALGIVLAGIAVNQLNDYFDYSSGLDSETTKTKFNGGSWFLEKGLIKPQQILALGISAFGAAVLIAAYLIAGNPVILPFVLVGGVTILLYTQYLTKIPFFSEPLVALSFLLVSLGSFVAVGGPLKGLGLLVFAALASGLQISIALLVNYVPDREADLRHGRRSGIVLIRSRGKRAVFYLAVEIISYLSLLAGIVLGAIPAIALVVFVTILPVASIYKGIANYRNPASYEKIMAKSALTVLAFLSLLVLAFL